MPKFKFQYWNITRVQMFLFSPSENLVARFGEHAHDLHVYKTIIQNANFMAPASIWRKIWRRTWLQGLPLMPLRIPIIPTYKSFGEFPLRIPIWISFREFLWKNSFLEFFGRIPFENSSLKFQLPYSYLDPLEEFLLGSFSINSL